MKLSADAILFGLRLIEERSISVAELAEHFRSVAASSVTDQLVALEERILARSPQLADAVSRLSAEVRFVPLDCGNCRARLRAPSHKVSAAPYCPLCGEAIVTGRRLLFAEARPLAELRAAEGEAPYYRKPTAERFAHFELVKLVGRGGAGKVYEARNTKGDRTVALKLLSFRPLETSAATFERLRREARVASSIVHDHIVRVFDLGVAEGLSSSRWSSSRASRSESM